MATRTAMEGLGAMVLAAGKGTRLAPLTSLFPKPLLPMSSDRSLLDVVMSNLYLAGVRDFAVNSCHLGDVLEDAITASEWDGITTVRREEELLGSGGPVVNAKAQLERHGRFILHNGDILTDFDLTRLVEALDADGVEVAMALLDGPENKVAVDSSGTVVDILDKIGAPGVGKLTYAGIAAFSNAVFDFLPDTPVWSSIVTAIIEMIRVRPGSVKGVVLEQDDYWSDLGSVALFERAFRAVGRGEVALPPTVFPDGPLRSTAAPLFEQGSERLFLRAAIPGGGQVDGVDLQGESSVVVMLAPSDPEGFERQVAMSRLLGGGDVGIPRVFVVSEESRSLIMEDLGDDTLAFIAERSDEAKLSAIYRGAVDYLLWFQSATYAVLDAAEPLDEEAPPARPRFFGPKHLRWETRYFQENLLERFLGLSAGGGSLLAAEFDALAESVAAHPRSLVHRDFQSTNILVKDGEFRVVDFQGARVGPFLYDSASLINDPYRNLPTPLRRELRDHYFHVFANSALMKKMGIDPDRDIRALPGWFNDVSVQRLTQALGAFAFLGLVKGKKRYLDHIPAGIALLRETLSERAENGFEPKLPHLTKLMLDEVGGEVAGE